MQKLYYSISEVCKIVDEEQHILRYWEKEFEELNPKKNRAGNRIYSEKDITLINTIKKLLRQDKLSLKGAKQHIKESLARGERPASGPAIDFGRLDNQKPKTEIRQKKVALSQTEAKQMLGLFKKLHNLLTN